MAHIAASVPRERCLASTDPQPVLALTLGSIGVVYGDIGTSPLYALREAWCRAGAGRRADPRGGARRVSLIIWALILIVTVNTCVS